MTVKRLKIELKKAIDFFNERDEYKNELRKNIKKYGVASLPKSIQRTIPVDMKVLYELKWYLQPKVWLRILQISWLNTENEGMRRATNGRA